MYAKIFIIAFLVSYVCADDRYGYDSEDGDSHFEPQPYHFGYHVKDHHGEQHREEASDGQGNVKGSYGFVDEKGIHREVHYVADDKGFRAEIKTNEPGTANQQPASVGFQSDSQDYLHFHEDIPEHGNGYF
ncbi:cuticle protein 10.9-like [Parasteatoda tepidariorum]|uniref:cuticle protein 10.9-like n=1 Tax=Parasteatoda tepidariorum TaxID=114398 RepID=UPI001C72109C|nr:cuticle protein 10.9-like [Parasteatoda tepidariorum]